MSLIENKGLDYHSDYKIKKHLLKMLLKNDLYNDFCVNVEKTTLPVFNKSGFYEIFPYSSCEDDFIQKVKNIWEEYIILQTCPYILEIYNELGRQMQQSGMFKTLFVNVTDRDEKVAKINGIFLARREISDGTWNNFMTQNDLSYLFNSLPRVIGEDVGNDTLLFLIRGFNDHLSSLTLQE